tara:strand:- start:140 stop:985 length:846 start_codon:yes stop_codon:yes gene_type:complete
MKVLLTGHKGFIGQNLHKRIKELGWECFVLDYEIFEGDVEEQLTQLMSTKFDCIFHVGANSNTMDHDYNSMMRTNYLFSKHLFDLAGDTRIVYSSSAANYGDNGGLPTNIYAWSKKAAEDYGLAKCKNFVALRYFNVYGPHEAHKGRMASVAYQSWQRRKMPLFPNHPRRDFVYVKDVVEANIFAATQDVERDWYDVGTGQANTFQSLVECMGNEWYEVGDWQTPPGYQYYTRASKFMPKWKATYSMSEGCEEYKEYLNNKVDSNTPKMSATMKDEIRLKR